MPCALRSDCVVVPSSADDAPLGLRWFPSVCLIRCSCHRPRRKYACFLPAHLAVVFELDELLCDESVCLATVLPITGTSNFFCSIFLRFICLHPSHCRTTQSGSSSVCSRFGPVSPTPPFTVCVCCVNVQCFGRHATRHSRYQLQSKYFVRLQPIDLLLLIGLSHRFAAQHFRSFHL